MNLNKITTIAEAIKWLDRQKYTYTVQYLNYIKPSIGLSSLNNKDDNDTLPARALTVIFSQNIYSDEDIAEHIEQVTSNLNIDRIAFLPDNKYGPYDGGGYMVKNLYPLYSEDKNTIQYCTNTMYGSFYLTLAEINQRYVGEVIYVKPEALFQRNDGDQRISCRILQVYDKYLKVEINGIDENDPSYNKYDITYLDFTL